MLPYEELLKKYDEGELDETFINICCNLYTADYIKFAKVNEDGSFDTVFETDYNSVPLDINTREWICLTDDEELLAKGKSTVTINDNDDWTIYYKTCDETGSLNYNDRNRNYYVGNSWTAAELSNYGRGQALFVACVISSGALQYRIPVIETGAGICHTYFDKAGDVVKGAAIVNNAKTRRVSVCNALDCLVIHEERLADLPAVCADLAASNVIIYADEQAYSALEGSYPSELLQHATAESFGTEFLDYKMSIRTVGTFEAALKHIATYSSKHSECIVSEDKEAIGMFQKMVDAACVYANVSTAFTDGGQFGFGAEIGISTQKLHARGPMALPELTTYKYLIEGEGQVRSR